MNSIAEFVYRIASTRNRKRFLWSLAAAVFWYGAVTVMVVLAPLIDRLLEFDLSIHTTIRLTVGIILLVIGLPIVALTITRFLRIKGTPIPFNPPPTLVISGLYGIVRNPMHLGWTIVLIGIAILMQSLTLLVIFIPMFLVVHVLYIKLIEEKELEKKFGQAYLNYKKHVPMWLPKMPRT
jgi:protein-S-isoprenylcysteine O-methyltransferase Ste14